MKNPFNIKTISMASTTTSTCTQCTKDAEYHNFYAHFGGDKPMQQYCACGRRLITEQVKKQHCALCGTEQVYQVRRCPITIDQDRPFPWGVYYTFKYLFMGIGMGHSQYKGNLIFKHKE